MILEAIAGFFRAIFNCTKRQLDNEIDRRIEIHENEHSSQAPIVITINNQSPASTPPVRRSTQSNLSNLGRVRSSLV